MSHSLEWIGAALAASVGLLGIASGAAQAQAVYDRPYYSDGRYQVYSGPRSVYSDPRYQAVPDDDDDVVVLPPGPRFAPRPPMAVPDRPYVMPNQRYVPDQRYAIPDRRYMPDPGDDVPDRQASIPQNVTPQGDAPDDAAVVPPQFRRQVVAFTRHEMPGTIVIDTPNAFLYYVMPGGRAIRYGIGVGREGFTWSGVRSIDRKQEWPDWHPPAEMIARQPYLPRFMAGGPGNPLGARAMYLKGTLFRIHGTSEPSTIGKHVSSGCIRMLNADAIDLYNRTPLGTRVVVLPDHYRPERQATK